MKALAALWRVLGQLSGVEMAYVMGVTNGALQLVQQFGVTLTTGQVAAITGVVNAVLVLLFHLAAKTTPPRPAAAAGA